MRGTAMSVWIFINLLCFGMCGYLYLIWSQYWLYLEKQRYYHRPTSPSQRDNAVIQNTYSSEKYVQSYINSNSSNNDFRKNRRSAIGVLWNSIKSNKTFATQRIPSSNVVTNKPGSPRFPNTHKSVLEIDSDKYICKDITDADCESKSKKFKELILKEFHRILMSVSNVFISGLESKNTYNVKYESARQRRQFTGNEILCSLRKINLQTVTSKDEPFASEGFRIPRKVLHANKTFDKCAVVTSAGALFGSGLGSFIDSHDMVLRFNNAPTENYTEDVGSKTTFRVLNSQVVTKPKYNFLENEIFSNVSILIWDPSNYSSSLVEWYRNPDFNLFPIYKKVLRKRPKPDVHILRPGVLWQLWSVLQDSSQYRLRRNPPSSGFIGLWFALHRCNQVRVFEYVPSARVTRRCHYHSPRTDIGCTLGAWHPLAQEKTVAEQIRDNSDIQVFQLGYINIPGFKSINC